LDPESWDHRELDRYGLGTVRDPAVFYKVFLIDTKERKATQLCPMVRFGIMHKDFYKYLRPDGKGIDYSYLLNYDSIGKITEQRKKMNLH
jgi:hypothetical protein